MLEVGNRIIFNVCNLESFYWSKFICEWCVVVVVIVVGELNLFGKGKVYYLMKLVIGVLFIGVVYWWFSNGLFFCVVVMCLFVEGFS